MNAPTATRIEAAAEDFYALIPAHVRTVDAAQGYPLKALVTVLSSGLAEIDAEIDTLLDSLFVDTAPEAALADFAALVAAEPLRPLPEGAGHNQRAYIAKTLGYRRRKGTAGGLEALAADVGGFGAVAVEYFMRLARTQHLIDVRPERPGTAILVAGETAARTATAFDRLPRLADLRSIARAAGRHHVPSVGVHLLRPIVPAFAAPPGTTIAPEDMSGVPAARPWLNGTTVVPGYFQLAAQPGGVLRLFNPDRRAESGGGRVAEVDLRDRLRRLPLHLETEELRRADAEDRPAALGERPWFDETGQPFTIFVRTSAPNAVFERVPPEQVLIANLEAMPAAGARPAPDKVYEWFVGDVPKAAAKTDKRPIRCGFDPVTGRLITAPPVAPAKEIVEVRVAYGYGIGREIGAGAQDRNDDDVPFDILDTDELTHFVRIVDSTSPASGAGTAADQLRTVPTLAAALADWAALAPVLAAGSPGRRGMIVLARCDIEAGAGSPADFPVAVHPGTELHIVSAQWREKRTGPGIADNPDRLGYVVGKARRFTAAGRLRVTASAAPPAGGRAGVLILNGLEVTAGVSLSAAAVSQLTVRHCTLRAPGAAALETTAALRDADIRIERSIVGRIRLDFGAGPAAGSLAIAGSLVSADGFGGDAVAAATIDADLKDVTIFGASAFKSLEATNVVFVGQATVARTQAGCVRYSAIAPNSKVPRRFRCQPDLAIQAAAARKGSALTAGERDAAALGARPIFLDTDLGEPTVAMLHPLTSVAIAAGGEGDSEIGVFSGSAERLRMSNIESLFDDYVPVGLEAGLIDDTRSTAVARRRNRP
jgi:hypothetical protein